MLKGKGMLKGRGMHSQIIVHALWCRALVAGVGGGATPTSVIVPRTCHMVVLCSYSSSIIAVCCHCHVVPCPRHCPMLLLWRRPVSSPCHRCDVSSAVSLSPCCSVLVLPRVPSSSCVLARWVGKNMGEGVLTMVL
jgi:hypothetical protein